MVEHDSRECLRRGIDMIVRSLRACGYVVDSLSMEPVGERCVARVASVLRVPGGPFHTAPVLPELPAELAFALNVLLGEPDATAANALADYLIDQGPEYATAVAEKAARDERERIADRLYSEASHALGKGDEMSEYAAAALSSVADDLVMNIPPTAPNSTPSAE